MERSRQTKVIAIIALVVAIIGISLGFAAFSNVLTISSSANVKPEPDDFKIVIYGTENLTEDNIYDSSAYTSTTQSIPLLSYDTHRDEIPIPTASNAVISSSNDGWIISNLDATFYEFADSATYSFMIKNEGNYNGYVHAINPVEWGVKSCIIPEGSGTSESLAEGVCSDVNASISGKYYNSNNVLVDVTSFPFTVAPGSQAFITISINYEKHNEKADGDVKVVFSDLKFEVSTNPNAY